MFRIESEAQLLECFRPLDRGTVVAAKDFAYPLFVKDYLAWGDPGGARTFLVFSEAGSTKPLGISFRRASTPGAPAHLCDWCHSPGGSYEIGLLVAEATDRRRVGVNACLDLGCARKLEDRSERSGENARLLMRGLLEKASRFARQSLF